MICSRYGKRPHPRKANQQGRGGMRYRSSVGCLSQTLLHLPLDQKVPYLNSGVEPVGSGPRLVRAVCSHYSMGLNAHTPGKPMTRPRRHDGCASYLYLSVASHAVPLTTLPNAETILRVEPRASVSGLFRLVLPSLPSFLASLRIALDQKVIFGVEHGRSGPRLA